LNFSVQRSTFHIVIPIMIIRSNIYTSPCLFCWRCSTSHNKKHRT